MTAEAIERAGFTDEPVNGTIAKWMTIRVSGITKAAWVGAFFVATRITMTKNAVKSRSITTAWMSSIPYPGRVSVPCDGGLAGHGQDERGRADPADELGGDVAHAGHRVQPPVEDTRQR